MNIDTLVSRLQKVNNQLMTISSFQRIQDMSDKRTKPCTCEHHRTTSVTRCPGKCNANERKKKKCRCSCRHRPRICSCTRGTNDQITSDYRSKESDIEDDSKEPSEKSSHREKRKETIRDDYFENIESTKKSTHHEKPREIDAEESFQKIESTKKSDNEKPREITPDESFQKIELTKKSPQRVNLKEIIQDYSESFKKNESKKKSPNQEKTNKITENSSSPNQEKPNKITENSSIEWENESTKKSSHHHEKTKAIERDVSFENNESTKRSSNHEKSKEITRDVSFENNKSSEKSSDHNEKPKEITRDHSIQNNVTSDKSAQHERQKEIELDNRELSKRNVELEEKLKNMDCSMSCLREEGNKQAACLMEALERARKDVKLASRSRNLAMDLAKQSRDQTDSVKASRDEINNRINVVQENNTKLQCECDELRCKLKEITDKNEKKYAEVDDKVNRIKQKEIALTSEKSELERSVIELTNHVKLQKQRICDLTLLCTNQRDLLRENENCISTKIAKLTEAEDKIQSTSCRCRQLQEQIDELSCRLNEEAINRENLQKQLDERQDNCDCELQIKNKIIGDQVETIKKLKKLLQDSEKMAHQAACEFETLRDELHCLKQSNKSLRLALDEFASYETSEDNEFCERCNILEARINSLEEQKEKAMMAAKFAASKLCETTNDYEQQLNCEKRHNEYVNNLVERQDIEIRLLKKEILCVKEFRSRRSNDYIDQ